MQKCIRCEMEKEMIDFYSSGGYSPQCNTCAGGTIWGECNINKVSMHGTFTKDELIDNIYHTVTLANEYERLGITQKDIDEAVEKVTENKKEK